MIRGFLFRDESMSFVGREDNAILLVFMCPACRMTHQLWVTFGQPFLEGKFRAWHYELESEPTNEVNLCTISPGIDFNQFCGFKIDGQWQVEVLVLSKQSDINSKLKIWIRNE